MDNKMVPVDEYVTPLGVKGVTYDVPQTNDGFTPEQEAELKKRFAAGGNALVFDYDY